MSNNTTPSTTPSRVSIAEQWASRLRKATMRDVENNTGSLSWDGVLRAMRNLPTVPVAKSRGTDYHFGDGSRLSVIANTVGGYAIVQETGGRR